MPYSQKYTLVAFLKPIDEGIEVIKSISVVDMFPGGDWRQRKVVRTFNLQEGVE